MNTDKVWIKNLAAICARKELQKVVIAPGSRSAPLVIAFSRQPEVECISIVDERSAAFFALGMAQQLNKPIGLVCTSGSALLNFAPAIAEAYYQKVPLIVFSADRPTEMIDQKDGQTIRQFDVYKNFIKRSYNLPSEPNDPDALWYSDRIVSEAINIARYPEPGPVHINIPLREPLYNQNVEASSEPPKVIEQLNAVPFLSDNIKESLLDEWNRFSKKLILFGAYNKDDQISRLIASLSNDPSVVILSETTSNLSSTNDIKCIDPVLEVMNDGQQESYQPELLVTLGGEIVSKKIKAFLRKNQPAQHWHINPAGKHTDTFKSLTKVIGTTPFDFLSVVQNASTESNYNEIWTSLYLTACRTRDDLLGQLPFCDLSVFSKLIKSIPADSNLHFANSTPVRYSNLFEIDPTKNISANCNRGTSGIEGSVSTTSGAAYVNNKLTTIITGDLAFFYDSNALWNKHLPANLRIIIINNSGGNIFRIIPGPSDLKEFEEFFETGHELSVEYLAKTYHIPYYFCDNFEALESRLKTFFQPAEKAVILEIKTPKQLSAEILREYMNMQKQNNGN